MIRNLKVLGLALAAVFALSAVVASAASAQLGTLTSTGPVTLDGTQTGAKGSNALTATFPTMPPTPTTVECPNAIYTGHKYNQTPHTFIPNDVTTFTVTPHYGVCEATVSTSVFPATVDMNGCDYVFHLEGTKSAMNDEYFVSNTVICPAGKHITLTLFSNAANHTANKPFCHITVFEKIKEDYTGLIARDTTNGDVDITGTVAGIKVEKNTGVLCPAETDNNAKLDLDITVKGTNEAGEQTSIKISHL